MLPLMLFEIGTVNEGFRAIRTLELRLSSVREQVAIEILLCRAPFRAHHANEILRQRVESIVMLIQIRLLEKTLAADVAFEWQRIFAAFQVHGLRVGPEVLPGRADGRALGAPPLGLLLLVQGRVGIGHVALHVPR